ncbi:MAG: relaxase/mobilization nuclease domain-containing protein [Nitrosomonas sp.]|nr:relaxase/mobilization nuclease domain-containing protein [Nitrosomonas sp.]
MIAKHIAIKRAEKSSFSRLVNYLVRKEKEEDRPSRVIATNCVTSTLDFAVFEIECTQERNTRARSDKTYHLVISFDSNIAPPDAVLADIEHEFCKALGFEEHQRISVAHNDTENFHIHLAINKIHPQKLTIQEPYRDFWKLGKACEILEYRHGLNVVNHRTNNRGLQSRAQDMEHHAGVSSLQTWIKANALLALRAANDWQSFHVTAMRFGLELFERGNGFTFKAVDADGQKIFIKASSVDRSLSKTSLEKRLGSFEPSIDLSVKVRERYRKEFMDTAKKSLYQNYLEQRNSIIRLRQRAYRDIQKNKQERIRAQKEYFDAKRKLIKITLKFLGPIAKKLILNDLYQDYRKSIKEINTQYSRQIDQIKLSYELLSWNQWQRKTPMTTTKISRLNPDAHRGIKR